MKQVDNCLACNLFADLTKLCQCAEEESGWGIIFLLLIPSDRTWILILKVCQIGNSQKGRRNVQAANHRRHGWLAANFWTRYCSYCMSSKQFLLLRIWIMDDVWKCVFCLSRPGRTGKAWGKESQDIRCDVSKTTWLKVVREKEEWLSWGLLKCCCNRGTRQL